MVKMVNFVTYILPQLKKNNQLQQFHILLKIKFKLSCRSHTALRIWPLPTFLAPLLHLALSSKQLPSTYHTNSDLNALQTLRPLPKIPSSSSFSTPFKCHLLCENPPDIPRLRRLLSPLCPAVRSLYSARRTVFIFQNGTFYLHDCSPPWAHWGQGLCQPWHRPSIYGMCPKCLLRPFSKQALTECRPEAGSILSTGDPAVGKENEAPPSWSLHKYLLGGHKYYKEKWSAIREGHSLQGGLERAN